MSIQHRLKAIRKDLGLSQEDFANSIGLKRANYSQIEIEKQYPTIDTIIQVARIYRISYYFLLDGEGEMYRSDTNTRSHSKNQADGADEKKAGNKAGIEAGNENKAPKKAPNEAPNFENNDFGQPEDGQDNNRFTPDINRMQFTLTKVLHAVSELTERIIKIEKESGTDHK